MTRSKETLISDDFTTDPIEGEVYQAVAAYKMMLVKTGHRALPHRLKCWAGDSDARRNEAVLQAARQQAKRVVQQSAKHREVLERLVRQQPEGIAERDNLLSLLSESVEM